MDSRLNFLAVQFHPERNPFEWDTQEDVSHTPDAIRAMQYLSEFFINEARQNANVFPSADVEQKALIYNFHPMFTGNLSESYPGTNIMTLF